MNSGSIQRCSSMSPDERTGHSMTILNNDLFIYGGCNNSHSCLFKYIWKYNIYGCTWSKIPVNYPSQVSCSFAEILAVGTRLYVFGCKGLPFNRTIFNIMSHYDTKADKFEVLFEINTADEESKDKPYYVSSILFYNGSIYIFAGTLGNVYTNSIFRYSLSDKTWSQLQQKGEIPKLSSQIYGCIFDDQFYCFDDNDRFRKDQFHNIYILNLKTGEWSSRETFPDYDQYPSSRINFSISFSQTEGYLSGGMSTSKTIKDDLWVIDLRTLKWRKLKFKLENRAMLHRSSIHDNSALFIFGGIDENNKRVNRLQKYYIHPPSLYQFSICVAMENQNDGKIDELPISLKYNMIRGGHRPKISFTYPF